jgi:malate-CoA ligase subunit alpha
VVAAWWEEKGTEETKAILINELTRILVQGFTGDKATLHVQRWRARAAVGGVTPGKGG